MTTSPTYRIRKLTGRCSDGFERDSGRRYHAVPGDSIEALCGAIPGRTSAGWSVGEGTEITCPKCLKLTRAPNPLEQTLMTYLRGLLNSDDVKDLFDITPEQLDRYVEQVYKALPRLRAAAGKPLKDLDRATLTLLIAAVID